VERYIIPREKLRLYFQNGTFLLVENKANESWDLKGKCIRNHSVYSVDKNGSTWPMNMKSGLILTLSKCNQNGSTWPMNMKSGLILTLSKCNQMASKTVNLTVEMNSSSIDNCDWYCNPISQCQLEHTKKKRNFL
jgi:hypothetical protein